MARGKPRRKPTRLSPAAEAPETADGLKPAEEPSYKRLTDADRLTILHLHDSGISQMEIARRLTRSVSTIHEVLQTYAPTVDIAKRKLRAAAERMADNIVRNGLPRDHIQALNGLGVLQVNDNAGLTLVINGMTLHGTGREPSETPAIDAEILSPLQLPAQSESQ